MRPHHLATTLAAALALLAGGCSKPAKTGCKKDTDCKGERVCEKGKCVSQASEKAAEAGSKGPGPARAALKPGQGPAAPGATLRTPGSPIPAPGGSPSTPPGGVAATGIQVCLGQRCVDLGGGAGTTPQDLMAMFGMLQKLVMGGLSGTGGPTEKLRVCVSGQCVTLDKSLLKDPMSLLKLFSRISPNLLQQLFQSMVAPRPGYRGPHAPRIAPPRGGAKAPGLQSFRSFDELRKAGDRAVGRTAELAGLAITSVSDSRLVLEGPGKEMIVLKIPRALKSLLPRLRITTQRVTVRFRVLSRPIGKLLHGELVSYS